MITDLDIGDGNSVFAVFDGHGGEHVARFCKKHFVELLLQRPSYLQSNYQKALESTFLEIDNMLLRPAGQKSMMEIVKELKEQQGRQISKQLEFLEDKRLKGLPWHVGCTACVVLVTRNHIYCANAGDSRAILCKTM
jgi:serine/threonine protein phosphatase PrpC